MARSSNSQNKTSFNRPTTGKTTQRSLQKVVESAEVIDVIMHPKHPAFDRAASRIVGSVKARPMSRFNTQPGNVEWYSPMFANLYAGYPLIGETVLLVQGSGKSAQFSPNRTEMYYLPAVNVWQDVNHNQNPNITWTKQPIESEAEECNPSGVYSTNPGAEKITEEDLDVALGDTFEEKQIAPLLPYEGDTILQGKFGQSIRFGATNLNADTPNYWSNEGTNGDAITIISNGHVVPVDSDFHLEDINRDCAIIIFCEGQQIPLTTPSDNWETYETTFEKENTVQIGLDFVGNPDVVELDEVKDDKTIEDEENATESDIEDEKKDEERVEKKVETNGEFITRKVQKIADSANADFYASVVNYFVENGATPHGAAGLCGNLLSEGMGSVAKTTGGYPQQCAAELEMWGGVPKPGFSKNHSRGNSGDPALSNWVGVGVYEQNAEWKGKDYGPGEYSNWSGGVGIAQWTGTRRTRIEQTLLGSLRFNDGGGGPPYGKSNPKPLNRDAYNRALRTATYNCPKLGPQVGVLAQCAYLWHEEITKSSRYKPTLEAMTTHEYTVKYAPGGVSNVSAEFAGTDKSKGSTVKLEDEQDISVLIVANFEVPGSFLRRKKADYYRTKNGKKELKQPKKDWEATKIKRGEASTDSLTLWNMYYGDTPLGDESKARPDPITTLPTEPAPAQAVNTNTQTATPPMDILIENYLGYQILERNIPPNDPFLAVEHPDAGVEGSKEEYVIDTQGGTRRGSISDGMNDIEIVRWSIQDSIDDYDDGERLY